MMIDDKCEKILTTLYECPKGVGFREIKRKTGMNQSPLMKRLSLLKNRNLIIYTDEPITKRKGKNKIHRLTKKGRGVALKFIGIEPILSDIREKALEISSKLDDITDWSRNSRIHTESVEIKMFIEIKKLKNMNR